ncbi:nucleotide exchange factor GrpE [Apibacter raozihei]|uniref:nucleotide exchange factor GrpE n=1 Tax=Apibacter raozihei TaxID=2500547 RepID=UPI000FE2AE3A|nr:nucleotide exchange factor GrpE [Apibacter raozihei]
MSKHNENEENELIEEPNNNQNSQEETENVENLSDIKKDSGLEEKLAQEKDKFIRLFAEFDNYKKRVTKERQDLIKYSNKDLLESLLPVLDDFDRAMKELEKDDTNAAVLEGVKLIYNKLYNTLKDKGLSPIEVKSGDDFNLDLHEAITQIQAPDESLKDKIVDVVQQGYLLHDKVIRYAKVVIGK